MAARFYVILTSNDNQKQQIHVFVLFTAHLIHFLLKLSTWQVSRSPYIEDPVKMAAILDFSVNEALRIPLEIVWRDKILALGLKNKSPKFQNSTPICSGWSFHVPYPDQ